MPNQRDRQTGSLAAGIAERLALLGMSRRELARRANLSRQTIHNIEKGGNTNLKPSTFQALDDALYWEPGTALLLALGRDDPSTIEGRLLEYLTRIAIHLSHMSTTELELTLIMMEENQLGTSQEPTKAFSEAIGQMVKDCLEAANALREANRKNAC